VHQPATNNSGGQLLIEQFEVTALDQINPQLAGRAVAALEHGAVLIFPQLDFRLTEADRRIIMDGSAAGKSKNISYDARTAAIKGTDLSGLARDELANMMERYSAFAEALVLAIAPKYSVGLSRARTSFRPTEIAGRETSWRKDDRRRHVDAFPSSPTGGARILRVFMNVDQRGTPRHWRVGPDFESYARTFLPLISSLPPGAASLMSRLGITKSRRTIYDQTMLGLHDASKRDLAWQERTPATDISFLPGQIWMVFTDQLPHAATSGCNALEQTFHVAPNALASPLDAPLAILSRLTGKDMTQVLF
jgi:hypothetical protein